MPIAVPLVRASSGRISGTKTQGTQFTDMPKNSMYRKKNVTDALAKLRPVYRIFCLRQ